MSIEIQLVVAEIDKVAWLKKLYDAALDERLYRIQQPAWLMKALHVLPLFQRQVDLGL